MENASKALIMAGEILIGVMILSIGVYLFNLFASYSEERYKRIEDTQIAEFNERFLKFTGQRTVTLGSSEITVPVEATIHDIIGLANLAQKNNIQYELQDSTRYSDNSLYVQIDMPGKINLEKMTTQDFNDIIKSNSLRDDGRYIRYYKATYHISEQTQRVNYMKFIEFTEDEYARIDELYED